MLFGHRTDTETFSRFDICLGHLVYCQQWYDGQADPLYARQCKISRYLKISPLFSFEKFQTEDEYEVARWVYENLVSENQEGEINEEAGAE